MLDTTTTPSTYLAGLREPLDFEGRLEEDLPCRGCGYNLRGHTTVAKCPECGAAVVNSLRYFLRYSSRRWVASLASGANALCIGVIASVAAWAALFIATLLPGEMLPVAFGFAVGGFATLASAGMLVVGLWLLTAREPSRRRGPQPTGEVGEPRFDGGWVRVLLRAALPTTAALLLGWGIVSFSRPGDVVLRDLIGLCIAVAGGLLSAALLWLHLAVVLRRVPDRALIRLARIALAATVLTGLLVGAGFGTLVTGLSVAKAITFSGGHVRWHIGGDSAASAPGGGLPLATIESEVLPGTAAGTPQQPGTVTVWTRTTLSLPRLLVAAAAIPPLAALICGGGLLFLSRRALRRAARQAERGG